MMTYFNIAVSLIVASFEFGEAVRSAAAAGESSSSTVEQVSSTEEVDAEVEQEIRRLADNNLSGGIHGTDARGNGIMYYVFRDIDINDISENMESKRVNVIKMLVRKYNVDVNQQNGDGSIPLHSAAGWHGQNDTASVEALIELGTDPNLTNESGKTPLHFASAPATIDALIRAGANVNVRDTDGNTPLIRAVLFGQVSVIRPLMMNGADHTIRNKEGKTALGEAGVGSVFGKTLQEYIVRDAKAMPTALGLKWKDCTLIKRKLAGQDGFLQLNTAVLHHISDFLCKKRE